MTTQAPTYYKEKVRETIYYSRFNVTEKIVEVEFVRFPKFSMRMGEVKMHMFNERIGDWMLLHRTRSVRTVKRQIEENWEAILNSFE